MFVVNTTSRNVTGAKLFPDSIEEGFVELVSISNPVAVPPWWELLLVPLSENIPPVNPDYPSFLSVCGHGPPRTRDRPRQRNNNKQDMFPTV